MYVKIIVKIQNHYFISPKEQVAYYSKVLQENLAIFFWN